MTADPVRQEEKLRKWLIWLGAALAGALVVGALVIGYLVLELKSTQSEISHVQRSGEPVAVCLLDAMKAVTPLLLREPAVGEPLEAYVSLQSRRYPGVVCPTRRNP